MFSLFALPASPSCRAGARGTSGSCASRVLYPLLDNRKRCRRSGFPCVGSPRRKRRQRCFALQPLEQYHDSIRKAYGTSSTERATNTRRRWSVAAVWCGSAVKMLRDAPGPGPMGPRHNGPDSGRMTRNSKSQPAAIAPTQGADRRTITGDNSPRIQQRFASYMGISRQESRATRTTVRFPLYGQVKLFPSAREPGAVVDYPQRKILQNLCCTSAGPSVLYRCLAWATNSRDRSNSSCACLRSGVRTANRHPRTARFARTLGTGAQRLPLIMLWRWKGKGS